MDVWAAHVRDAVVSTSLGQCLFSVLRRCTSGSAELGHTAFLCFWLLEESSLFSRAAAARYVPTRSARSGMRSALISPILPSTCYYLFVFIPVVHKVAANKLSRYLTSRKQCLLPIWNILSKKWNQKGREPGSVVSNPRAGGLSTRSWQLGLKPPPQMGRAGPRSRISWCWPGACGFGVTCHMARNHEQ